MDSDLIKERGEDREYPEAAIEDLLTMHEFIYKMMDFLQELIDSDELDPEFAETAEEMISSYENGIFEE